MGSSSSFAARDPPEVRALSRLTTATSAVRRADDIGPRVASRRSSSAATRPSKWTSPAKASVTDQLCGSAALLGPATTKGPRSIQPVATDLPGFSGGEYALIWQAGATRVKVIVSNPARWRLLETTIGPPPPLQCAQPGQMTSASRSAAITGTSGSVREFREACQRHRHEERESMAIQHTVVFRLAHEPGSPAESEFLDTARTSLTAIDGVTEFGLN